jgi:hypothetical protein
MTLVASFGLASLNIFLSSWLLSISSIKVHWLPSYIGTKWWAKHKTHALRKAVWNLMEA